MSLSKVSSQSGITLAANTADFAVRTTTDLGKTTRITLPPGSGTAKAHTALWWLCRDSSSDSLRSGLTGSNRGLNRGDVDSALLFSAGREGVGDEGLREIGVGTIVMSVPVWPTVIGGWTFPFRDTGISEVAVCVRFAASGRGSSWGGIWYEMNST